VNEQQHLLARILDVIAERFDRHAVLRGGMVLRLLGCERLTNDLAYIFVPYGSKKEIVDDLVAAVGRIPGATVASSLHSTCLRLVITVAGVTAQVEATAALDVPTEVLSTRELVREHGGQPRLVAVLAHPVALAHTMAAWNERRLVRDLYDIWFLLRMGVRPELHTLTERLRKPNYSKLVRTRDRLSPGADAERLIDRLRAAAADLTDKKIAVELSDFLPPAELVGLSMSFRAELAKLR
jgi:predicted nucleotidyltransferase component of viral defense system